mgnify:CR=1 FL=1
MNTSNIISSNMEMHILQIKHIDSTATIIHVPGVFLKLGADTQFSFTHMHGFHHKERNQPVFHAPESGWSP